MRDPVWEIVRHQGRTLVWLAGRTGFSHSHVKAMAGGRYPTGADFRAACVRALDLPEATLFAAPAEVAQIASDPVQAAS